MKEPFTTFVRDVTSVVRELSSAADVVERIEPLVRTLVQDRTWLEAPFRRPIPEKPYAQYLLYRPEDYAFSVVSFVWNPFQGSPEHDHGTWGVIGQYDGAEEETRYRKASASLEVIRTVVARPGDVSHVHPPDRDIHRIWNRTATPTVSIHIYGGDIGSQPRQVYDPTTGRTQPFVSGYDSVLM